MEYMVKQLTSNHAVVRISTNETVCICYIRRNADLIADILNEMETLRRDVRELKELLGYIGKYGTVSNKTPSHIKKRFCEIVDGWEEHDGGGD